MGVHIFAGGSFNLSLEIDIYGICVWALTWLFYFMSGSMVFTSGGCLRFVTVEI